MTDLATDACKGNGYIMQRLKIAITSGPALTDGIALAATLLRSKGKVAIEYE